MNRGEVSTITGRRQGPVLRLVITVSWFLAGVGLLGADGLPYLAGRVALILVILTPLARVAWLMYRWGGERDLRFFWTALALLGVVLVGAAVALAG
jgi:hypothetical protein